MRVPYKCECEGQQADGMELGNFAGWHPQGPSTQVLCAGASPAGKLAVTGP